jgi:hypothetical protein
MGYARKLGSHKTLVYDVAAVELGVIRKHGVWKRTSTCSLTLGVLASKNTVLATNSW